MEDFDPTQIQAYGAQDQQVRAQTGLNQGISTPQSPSTPSQGEDFDPSVVQHMLQNGGNLPSPQNSPYQVSPLPPQTNQGTSTPQQPPQAGSVTSISKPQFSASEMPADALLSGVQPSDLEPPSTPAQTRQQFQETNTKLNAAINQQNQQAAASLKKQGLTNTDTLGDQNITPWQRTVMGFSDNFAGKYNAFKKFYPDGDMREEKDANGQPFQVFTTNVKDKNLPWARLDASGEQYLKDWLNSVGNPDIPAAERTAKFLTFTSHFLENNSLDALINVALAVGTDMTGGIVKTAGSVALRSAGARTIGDEVVRSQGANPGGSYAERALNTVENSFKDGLAALGLMGLIKAPFVIGKASARVMRAVSGSGFMQLSPEKKAALQSLENLKQQALAQGMPAEVVNSIGYMPNQMLDKLPFLQRWSNQAQSLLGKIGGYIEKQKIFVRDVFNNEINRNAVGDAVNRGEQTLNSAKGTALAVGPKSPGVTFPQAGAATAEDLAGYAKRSQADVSKLYDARDATLPPGTVLQYNPAPALDAVARAEKGTPLPYQGEPKTTTSSLTDEYGKPLQVTTPGKTEVAQIEPLSPQAQEIADQIKLWSKSPPQPHTNPDGSITTVTDQIQALQRQLYELSQPDASGAIRLDESRSLDMRRGLQEMLDNPVGPESAAFNAANATAKQAAAERFAILNDPLVKRGYRQFEEEMMSTPESSVQSAGAFSGRQVSVLQRLQKILQPDTYNTLINSYRTSLFNNMDRLSDNVDKISQTPELKQLIFGDDTTAQAYKTLGDTWKEISNSGLEDAVGANRNANSLYREQTGAAFIEKLLENKNITQLQHLENVVLSNPNTEFASSIRNGIMKAIANKTIENYLGERTMNAPAFEKLLQHYDESTISRFLTQGDKAFLKDVGVTLNHINATGGMGDALVGAEQAANMARLKTSVLADLVEHWWIGKRFTNPTTQQFWYGRADSAKTPLQELIDNAAKGLTGMLPSDLPIALRRALILLNPGHFHRYINAEDQTNAALRNQPITNTSTSNQSSVNP